MRKLGQAIFARLANRAFLREKAKPFPTVQEMVFGEQSRSARRAAKRKAKARYRSETTLDDRVGDLAVTLAFYCMISIVFTFPGILALKGLPGRFDNSRFKGLIQLGLLLWLVAIYTSIFVFAFMGKELPAGISGGLLFLTIGVLFWLGPYDDDLDFDAFRFFHGER